MSAAKVALARNNCTVVQHYRFRNNLKDLVTSKSSLSDDDNFVDDDAEEDDKELDLLWNQRLRKGDLPSEFWQIRKLMKYVKNGNQTATVLTLCILMDFDLGEDVNQRAILEEGGPELLLNILETNEQRCKVAALKILKLLSKVPKFCRILIKLDVIPSLVNVLGDSFCQVKSLSAQVLADILKCRLGSSSLVIQYGGVEKLVSLLDLTLQHEIQLNLGGQISGSAEVVEVVRCGAVALAALSKARKCRHLLNDGGAVVLSARLLKLPADTEVLIPIVDMLQECATEDYLRYAILKEGIITHVIENIRQAHNSLLIMHCASVILKCAEEPEVKFLVHKHDGLKPLLAALNKCQANNPQDRPLLAALTGALWKCAVGEEDNVGNLQKLHALDAMLTILNKETDDEVLCNAVGCLAECANNPSQADIVARRHSIPLLVRLLHKTNRILLVNVSKALVHLCGHVGNMRVIEQEDGIRHLWSLLKNVDPEVQSSAAEAIHACIDQAPHITELVRNFVGGLELLVSLLGSPHPGVQASVCGVIAVVAKNVDNLAVITDNGAVAQLARLASNGSCDSKLQCYIAEAVANCCALESNAAAFGQENAVIPLVTYLKSSDEVVRKMAVKALALLSRHPPNCVMMRQYGAVRVLLILIGSTNSVIQEDAATALGNIRHVATRNCV